MLGRTILGYTIDEQIGSGGFGTVYRVSKSNIAGTEIRALKHISIPSKKQYMDVLNSMGGDHQKADNYFVGVLKNVINEIQIIRSMSASGTSNIVTYYENDIIEKGSPRTYDVFILMEYLKPLPDFLFENNQKVRDVVQLAKDMLSALAACHERHIIHRDIKEDNIFVAENGIYKLGDFGVSRVLSEKSGAVSMKGTPNYIAPEVYLGKEKYDNTVDLYSLGIVLYRLLNGARGPFMPDYPKEYTSADEDIAFEKRMQEQKPELPYFAKNKLGEAVVRALMPLGLRYASANDFYNAIVEAAGCLSAIELDVNLGQKKKSIPQTDTPSAPVTFPSKTFDIDIQASPKNEQPRKKAEPNRFQSVSDSFQDQVHDNDEKQISSLRQESESIPQEEPPSQRRQVPEQQVQQVAPERLRDNKQLIYLVPVVIIVLYVAMYMILIPMIAEKGISIVEWLFHNAEEIANTIQSGQTLNALSDVELPRIPFGVIYLIKILNWVLLSALIASLYYIGRTLHFKKPDISDNALFTGNEAYIKTMEIYEIMKRSNAQASKKARDAVYILQERFKNGGTFGTGSAQVIVCENEIAACLIEIERNVQGLFNESTVHIASSNIEAQCERIRSKLKIRIELKKK